jgi:hypothetical protein
MTKLWIKLALLLALLAPMKYFIEGRLEKARVESKLAGTPLSIELRQKLSQNLAIALLSGFRGTVADFIWLEAHVYWEEKLWFKLKEGIELSVILQPHCISFWDMGTLYMAYDASFSESENMSYSTEAYRIKRQRSWIEAGRKFLEEGIKNNPDEFNLYFKMGWLIEDKFKDPIGSIPFLEKAESFPEAPLFVTRMIGHMYEKGGDKKGAYEHWKKLWLQDHNKNPEQLWYKIEQWGRDAEEKLNIPFEQRVFPSKEKSPTFRSFP